MAYCFSLACLQAPPAFRSLAESFRFFQPENPLLRARSNPDVVGVSIRQDWADLEPSEGSFNWSFLDSEVAKAAAAGKDVLLRIRTQDGKPEWVTAAVQQAGGLFYNFDDDGVPTSIPFFGIQPFSPRKKP